MQRQISNHCIKTRRSTRMYEMSQSNYLNSLFYLLNTIPMLSLVYYFFFSTAVSINARLLEDTEHCNRLHSRQSSNIALHKQRIYGTKAFTTLLIDAKLPEKHIHREASPLPFCHLCRAVSHSHPTWAIVTQVCLSLQTNCYNVRDLTLKLL